MKIKSIKPLNMRETLKEGVIGVLDELELTGDLYREGNGLKLINVRLKERKPNTYPYEGSGNYDIVKDAKGRLVAQNKHFKHVKMTIRRGYYLQYNDWARLNNGLNDLCDKLDVLANITSSTHIIRRGLNRSWYAK